MKTLEQLKSEVLFYCSALNFPNDATDTFCAGLESICSDTTDFAELLSILSLYEETELCDYPSMLQKMKVLCEKHNIHEYTSAMLLFLLLADKLKERYSEKGIPKEIFYNTLFDLRYKLDECSLIHGVFGTSAGWWYAGFFRLQRFALGRLQFEYSDFWCDMYIKNGVELYDSDFVVGMHIPSNQGPLTYEARLDSYRKAHAFFKDKFKDPRYGIFCCHSWLLYPDNVNILPEKSNIVDFLLDFEPLEIKWTYDFGDQWRVFGVKNNRTPVDELPQNTSMQRAYVEWFKKGKKPGTAYGIVIYDSETDTILTRQNRAEYIKTYCYEK